MARECKLTGKRTNFAHNVSHANNKTKRKQLVNLKRKKVYIPTIDREISLRLSTKAIKTLNRIGIMQMLKKRNLTVKDIVKKKDLVS